MVSALLVVPILAGCLGGSSSESDEGGVPVAWPRGVHPYPMGNEWPADLPGTFRIGEVLHLPQASFDGINLDGWIIRPDVPEEVRVPIVLWTAPYFGQCAWLPPTSAQAALSDYPSCHYDLPSNPDLWDSDQISEAVPVRFLVEHGYAVAIYNVRGSGNSGGCFEWFGPNEQKDQAVLVEKLASLPWSNGRVGMMGLSYHGTTPWEAAIQNPPSLKTIVVAGMVSDPYTFSHTPQGATFTTIAAFNAHFAWRVSLSPPLNGPTEHYTTDHAPVVPQRACPEVVKAITEDLGGTLTDTRDGQYWSARRLIDRFPDVSASVFLTHGFLDLWGSGHQQQENAAWGVLVKAPKRQLEGQYGHMMPSFAPEDMRIPDWNATVLEWLDFWLKGIGDAPPREGLVDYQDNTGAWHESTAWPPADAHTEVVYLDGRTLSPAPGSGSSTFRSMPVVGFPSEAACSSTGGSDPAGPPGVLLTTEPVSEDVFLAGNPIAYLQITSNLPGGLVAVHLYDVESPDCDALEMRRLGVGVADLRFHNGNFQGTNFPINTRTPVRIDITNFAEIIPAGHRLGALLSYGDPLDRTGQPFYPQITLHQGMDAESSHLVVPLVNGTLGGSPPTLTYPPRPFVPILD